MQKAVAGQTESTSPSTAIRPAAPVGAPGLEYERFFAKEGIDPFDEVEWDVRSAVIGNEKGSVVFEQRDVEIPKYKLINEIWFRGGWEAPLPPLPRCEGAGKSGVQYPPAVT